MNTDIILNIVWVAVYIIIGGIALWYKTNTKLNAKVGEFISEAEEVYKDSVKAGGTKHKYVVDKLYELVPAYLRVIFTYDMVGKIVDNAFTAIEDYAKQQLDKITMIYTE